MFAILYLPGNMIVDGRPDKMIDYIGIGYSLNPQMQNAIAGVGIGTELDGRPFAIDTVVAKGAEVAIVEGIGCEVGKGYGVVGKG